MKPKYAQNIIVAIKADDKINWYILEKDLCFLDYNKVEKAYQNIGYTVTYDEAFRFGIKVVNEFTQREFLANIRQFQTDTEKLADMWTREKDDNEKITYVPSLFIDFDRHRLLSSYPEPASFEDYVPDGWKGKFEEFDRMIPQNQRYWVDK